MHASWEPFAQGAGLRTQLSDEADRIRPITYRGVLERWIEDPASVDAFRTALLATDGPGDGRAYFFEMPPVSRASLDDSFECVVLPAPALDRMTPEPSAFREHFTRDAHVATFANLSGDAVLVSPRDQPEAGPFPHLAAFARASSEEAWRALWRAVGTAALERLGASPRPLWISTSGLGVGWLHVRLDERPKYYQHTPYRVVG